jgi:hypothetical protein
VLLSLVAVLVAASGPLTLATPGFTCIGVEAATCAAQTERFGQLIASEGVFLTAPVQVREQVGADGLTQFLACDEDRDCLARFGVLLKVEGVLVGTVQRSEGAYFLAARVIRSKDATVWVNASTDKMKSETSAQAWLDSTARDFSETLKASQGTSAGVRWTPAIVGLVLAGAGAGLYVSGRGDEKTAPDVAQGKETFGQVLMVVGGVGVLWSLVWNIATPSAPVQASLVPTPGGGALVVGGTW